MRRKLVSLFTGIASISVTLGIVILLHSNSTYNIGPAAGSGSPAYAAASQAALSQEDEYARARERLVKHLKSSGIKDARVLEAIRKVPRHLFVPERDRGSAYEDRPLPIGYGQTISQPYIVALMTELLTLQKQDKVLEIGTGSGYQAAILAEIVEQVYSIEIIPELSERAEKTLKSLGYKNIKLKIADGYYGWQEEAPFDAIIVTAAPDHIPQPLVRQLKDGGVMVIPIGPPGAVQTLFQIVKQGNSVKQKRCEDVLFVPLTRGKN